MEFFPRYDQEIKFLNKYMKDLLRLRQFCN